MSYPDNDYRDYLEHSSKGKRWPKHKYLYIDANGNYVYPKDVAKTAASKLMKNYSSGQIGPVSYEIKTNGRKTTDQKVTDKKDKNVYYFNDDGSIRTFKKRSEIKKKPPKKPGGLAKVMKSAGKQTVNLAGTISDKTSSGSAINALADAISNNKKNKKNKKLFNLKVASRKKLNANYLNSHKA